MRLCFCSVCCVYVCLCAMVCVCTPPFCTAFHLHPSQSRAVTASQAWLPVDLLVEISPISAIIFLVHSRKLYNIGREQNGIFYRAAESCPRAARGVEVALGAADLLSAAVSM